MVALFLHEQEVLWKPLQGGFGRPRHVDKAEAVPNRGASPFLACWQADLYIKGASGPAGKATDNAWPLASPLRPWQVSSRPDHYSSNRRPTDEKGKAPAG
jgi:hypothetical protein